MVQIVVPEAQSEESAAVSARCSAGVGEERGAAKENLPCGTAERAKDCKEGPRPC